MYYIPLSVEQVKLTEEFTLFKNLYSPETALVIDKEAQALLKQLQNGKTPSNRISRIGLTSFSNSLYEPNSARNL